MIVFTSEDNLPVMNTASNLINGIDIVKRISQQPNQKINAHFLNVPKYGIKIAFKFLITKI
uniref:Uncharacterized protein n=1 Tax=Rhizophagus irregularis (strain DAOM 181602 / DAOM 197198 / MUCL 43194) TaxID=747089 RepID=U9SIN0_RHIID